MRLKCRGAAPLAAGRCRSRWGFVLAVLVQGGWGPGHGNLPWALALAMLVEAGRSLRDQIFFLLRTTLKDRPKGPPTANCQLPTTTNRQPPPTANRDQPPTVNRCQPPPTTNHPSPTANCCQPPPTTNRQPPTGKQVTLLRTVVWP